MRKISLKVQCCSVKFEFSTLATPTVERVRVVENLLHYSVNSIP